MLDKNVSFFLTTKSTETRKTISLMQVVLEIQEGKYKKEVQKLRDGDKLVKENLPMIAVHGLFDRFRKKDNFKESTGIIIVDIDNIPEEDIEDVKEEIMSSDPHVLAAMKSPSGNGVKLWYLVDEMVVTRDTYREVGKVVSPKFKEYGDIDILSITDCLIMTWDPNILMNEEAYPRLVFLKEASKKESTLGEQDKNTQLWEDAEEFYKTVLLDSIMEKTYNNFHFIQVSVMDLGKYGFKHPTHDLSFVIEYSESTFKSSSENGRRFKEVVDIAEAIPQKEWPYKFNKEEENDEWEEDYSDYILKKDSVKKSEEKLDLEDSEEESNDEDNGLIDYGTLLKRVYDKIKEGDRVGYEISLKNFADNFRFKGTGILTITGIPSHGKTEFLDQIMVDLARLHGQKSTVVGFEQSPEEHIVKLSRKMVGKNITCPSFFGDEKLTPVIDKAVNWVSDNIKHLDTTVLGGDISKILKKAAILKNTHDYNYLILDPFNMLSIKSKAGGYEKIEEILRKLTMFSHQTGIMILLVAHPFKMKKDEKTGEFEIPDFYSVKGSSAFFEMSYHGLVIYRRSTDVLVRVLKVKQNNLGTTGADATFEYDKQSGRYIPINESGEEYPGDHWDTDWLDKVYKQ